MPTGLITAELQALYAGGLMDYLSDLWNIVDFISNMFYVTWIGLRVTAWFVVQVRQRCLHSFPIERNF